MSSNHLKELRITAVELQEKEMQLVAEAQSFGRDNPTGLQLAVKMLQTEITMVLQTSEHLHQKISDLTAGRGLEDIADVLCLGQIVSCQQRLVQLHTNNVRRIREILVQKVTATGRAGSMGKAPRRG